MVIGIIVVREYGWDQFSNIVVVSLGLHLFTQVFWHMLDVA